jgi:hypothetical protein
MSKRSSMSTKCSRTKLWTVCNTINLVLRGQDGLDAVLWRLEEPQLQSSMDSRLWNPYLEWKCSHILAKMEWNSPHTRVKLRNRNLPGVSNSLLVLHGHIKILVQRIKNIFFVSSPNISNIPWWYLQVGQFLQDSSVGPTLQIICLRHDILAECNTDLESNRCLIAGKLLPAYHDCAPQLC